MAELTGDDRYSPENYQPPPYRPPLRARTDAILARIRKDVDELVREHAVNMTSADTDGLVSFFEDMILELT